MTGVPQVDFITASEIAEYLYCNRAWWLKCRGFTNDNTENLAQGAMGHVQYSQQVTEVRRSERFGKSIMIIGIVFLVGFIIFRLLIH